MFDTDQIIAGTFAEIAEDRDAARTTVATQRRQVDGYGTVIIPAHDPDSATRLIGV